MYFMDFFICQKQADKYTKIVNAKFIASGQEAHRKHAQYL